MKSDLDHQVYAMKRLVVLKDDEGDADADAMQELLDEVRKLSNVKSEYVVQYITSSIDLDNSYLYVVMELLVRARPLIN